MIIYIIAGIAITMIPTLGTTLFVVLYKRRIILHQTELRRINEERTLQLSRASIQAEEQERMRIASELHDDIGVQLSSVRLYLTQIANEDTEFSNAVARSIELLDGSISHIRSLSHQLHPAILQQLGLEVALRHQLDIIKKSGALNVSIRFLESLSNLKDDVELAIFRVCQELINNILKHSNATLLQIESSSNGQAVSIKISHNGQGLVQKRYEELINKPGAIGLKNIANRVKSVDGKIVFDEAPNERYTVQLTVGS